MATGEWKVKSQYVTTDAGGNRIIRPVDGMTEAERDHMFNTWKRNLALNGFRVMEAHK